MNILISIGLFLAVYWKLRNQYYKRLAIKYSYMLYDLRDSLREQAVLMKINTNDWQFKYLDTSFSKTIQELPNLNLLLSIIISSKYKTKKSSKVAIIKGMQENDTYSLLYHEYSMILLHYIFEKMILLNFAFTVSKSLHITSKNIKSYINKNVKKVVSNITVAPETSTFLTYCP